MRALSTFVVCLLAAATAQARSPLHLQQRRTIEHRKRLGLARSQLRQYKTTQDPTLWVKGRDNRALAARVKVKLWRAEAVKARKTGDLQGALKIERRANRLSQAIQRYGAATRSYVDQSAAAQKQYDKYKEKPLGSPIYRLWHERSTPAEVERARGDHAANRIAARRLEMEGFTGAKPLRPHEVRRWLNKLPGSGRNRMSFSEPASDGSIYKWTIVRTGTRNGVPRGFVRTEIVHPDTGEVFTQYHGTSTSWARRRHGDTMSTMVLHHRHRRGKDGAISVPAGTLTTVSRESSKDSRRTTVHTETPTGARYQRTTTQRRDGSAERFEISRGPDGSIQESLARQRADGRWSVKDKVYDPRHGLAVFKQDSSGTQSERVVAPEVEQRLYQRLGKTAAAPRARIARHKDGSWTWRQVVTNNGSLGTIEAHGKDGKLGAVKSGYVSPLGTRYGRADRVVRGNITKPGAGDRPVKSRTYHYLRRDNNRVPDRGPPTGKVTQQDRERLQRAEVLVNKVRKRPIKAIIDDAGGEDNAYAQPAKNTVFGRTGGRMRTVTNVDVANMGSQFTRGSLPLQVGVMLHEGGHELQATRYRDPRHVTHRIQAGNLHALGRPLAAGVAELLAADANRTMERGADRSAGLGLGRLRKLTGDRAMTPADNVKMLRKAEKGMPHHRTWLPTMTYDSVRDRSRTLWRAYGQGLSKQTGQK